MAAPAAAQSEAEFVEAFAGPWQTLSTNFSDGSERCALTFDPTAVETGYALTVVNCAGDLAAAQTWGISERQLALFAEDGRVLARMGGSQQRLNGETVGGNALVLLRTDGAATQRDCVFVGYSTACASDAQLSAPLVSDEARVSVLTKLNARAEPSLSAEAVRELSPGTCVSVDRCTAGTQGIWCRAQVADASLWIKKEAVRLQRYPVVTFVNSCGPA